MANEIHTLNVGNTSYTIQPRVLGPMSIHNTNGAQFSVSSVVRYDTLLGENPFGPNKSTGYNNAVLSISRYSTDRYTSQLGFSGTGIYARWFNDKTPDATTPWRRFIMDDGGDTLNIDTPNVNVTGNTLNIDTPSVNVIGDTVDICRWQEQDYTINLGTASASANGKGSINVFTNMYAPMTDDQIMIGSVSYPFYKMFTSDGFYQSSDARLKTFGDNIKVDFDALSKLRKAYFTWNNDPNSNTYIGVSAQEIKEIYPEIVSGDDKLTVDYTKLSVIALAAVDELHRKNVELESRLAKLEAMLLK